MNGVILDYQTLSPEELNMEQLDNLPVKWTYYDKTPPKKTWDRIKDADIILTNKVVIDKDLIEKKSDLDLILILATGTNNVDLEAAKNAKIPVCNISGYSTESVAQHTFATLLNLKRNLYRYRLDMNDGAWSRSPFFCYQEYPIEDLSGLKMGLIGYGSIAKRVHEIAEVFGMDILISESLAPTNRSQEGRIPLDQLLKESDVVSLHCPLSKYSENLITKNEFEMMKESAILINMARGGIVHESDLFNALKNGDIAGAVTDVLTSEPPQSDHILFTENMPNLLITPHVAWASKQARQILVDQVVDVINGFLNGKIINQVNG